MEEISNHERECAKFIDDGARFLRTATRAARKRRKVFTPDLLYNIIAMSIEKHIMGYLLHRRNLPDNHTLRDLIDGLKRVDTVEEGLCDRMIRMDRFQEICCITAYHREVPAEKDIEEMLSLGETIRDYVRARMPAPVPAVAEDVAPVRP